MLPTHRVSKTKLFGDPFDMVYRLLIIDYLTSDFSDFHLPSTRPRPSTPEVVWQGKVIRYIQGTIRGGPEVGFKNLELATWYLVCGTVRLII